MRVSRGCLIIVIALLPGMAASGCATMIEGGKGVLAISTKVLEEGRKDAVAGEFNHDYKTCFAKAELIISSKEIANTSIYARDRKKGLIAFYYVDMNTTPVGLFFTEIDKTHTRIEVSSPSYGARDFIAKNLFLKFEEKTVK